MGSSHKKVKRLTSDCAFSSRAKLPCVKRRSDLQSRASPLQLVIFCVFSRGGIKGRAVSHGCDGSHSEPCHDFVFSLSS